MEREIDIRLLGQKLGMFSWAAISYSRQRFDAHLYGVDRSWARRCTADPSIFALGTSREEAFEECKAMDVSFQAFIRNEGGTINLGYGCGDVTIRLFRDVLVATASAENDLPPKLRFDLAQAHAAALGLTLERHELMLAGESDELCRCKIEHVQWAPSICTTGFSASQIHEAIIHGRMVDQRAPKKRPEKPANDGQGSLFDVAETSRSVAK
jgi:hypothetical protein